MSLRLSAVSLRVSVVGYVISSDGIFGWNLRMVAEDSISVRAGSKHITGSNERLFISTETQSANFRGNPLYQSIKTTT